MIATNRQAKKPKPQRKLSLSFKENERDNIIYNEICKHSSKGDL